ncbi:MFS transporter [Tessaracoccus sp. SD287]|uniref:MFS transporter n=1 Tax=Tessaracoccus sp. SD287 TaxID=2782008 RepID=UPI001A975771|nr:MFS transporter [Tessaracoccus sp. SD287]
MHQPATAPPRSLIVGLLVSVVAIAFQAVAVATAMPAAAEDLGRQELYAWTFTLFVIGMALATVLSGRLSDRVGPSVPLRAGLVLFGVGLLLAALAPSMYVLLVARFVQGFGGGAFNVALMVIVARTFPAAQRALMMTMFSVCWVLPAFIAPPIAAWLAKTFSWHWVFACMIPFVIATAVLSAGPLRSLSEQLRPESDADSAPVPIWAAFVATGGVALIQLAGQNPTLGSLATLVVGLVALAISLPRLMAPGFFRFRPGIVSVSWVRAMQAGGFFAAEAFLPLSLVETREMSLFRAGLMLTIGSIGWTVGSWLQAQPWLALRRDQLIQLGALFSLLGVAGIVVGTWGGLSVVFIGAGWTVGGLGMGLSNASGSLAVMQLSEPARLGRNTSSLQVSEALGNAMFTGLAGAVYANLRTDADPVHTFGWVFTTVTLVSLVALVIAMRIGRVANHTSGAGVVVSTAA